ARKPTLVLLNVRLPDMSGYTVCRALRDQRPDSMPIIFMSGERTEWFDRVGGLLLGADDYIVVPFVPDELVARVRTLLRRSERPSAVSRSATRSSTDSMPTESRTRFRGAAKGASAVDAWVMRAGCSIRLSTPPSDSASLKIFVSATRRTASSSDSARKEIIPP